MTADEFRAALDGLGIWQVDAARLMGVDKQTIWRWASGDARVPPPVARLVRAWERHPDLVDRQPPLD